MDRQITLVWRRRAWPRVCDGEEMDFVLVYHNSHGTFHETLNEPTFCLPLFYSSPKPLNKCGFFAGLALAEAFVVFQSRSDWVALPLLLFPLTQNVIPSVGTAQAGFCKQLKIWVLFFFLNMGHGNHTWKRHRKKT